MTSNSVVSDKKLVGVNDDFILKATRTIEKLTRHVLLTDCQHCKSVLKGEGEKEAGLPSPAHQKATHQHNNPNQQEEVLGFVSNDR